MALPAAIDRGCGVTVWESLGHKASIPFDNLCQSIVKRSEDSTGFGMVRRGELLGLMLVTFGAVFGRYDNRDVLSEVLVGIDVLRVGAVAFEAADIGSKVQTLAPLLIDSRIARLVTFNASLTFL